MPTRPHSIGDEARLLFLCAGPRVNDAEIAAQITAVLMNKCRYQRCCRLASNTGAGGAAMSGILPGSKEKSFQISQERATSLMPINP